MSNMKNQRRSTRGHKNRNIWVCTTQNQWKTNSYNKNQYETVKMIISNLEIEFLKNEIDQNNINIHKKY